MSILYVGPETPNEIIAYIQTHRETVNLPPTFAGRISEHSTHRHALDACWGRHGTYVLVPINNELNEFWYEKRALVHSHEALHPQAVFQYQQKRYTIFSARRANPHGNMRVIALASLAARVGIQMLNMSLDAPRFVKNNSYLFQSAHPAHTSLSLVYLELPNIPEAAEILTHRTMFQEGIWEIGTCPTIPAIA